MIREIRSCLCSSVGQHRALEAIAGRLQEGERLFAYFDDVYVVCSFARVSEVHAILAQELERHAHIRLHLGKTQIWIAEGLSPQAWQNWLPQQGESNQMLWFGEGMHSCHWKARRTPIGRPEYVEDFLLRKSPEHDTLFTPIQAVEDLQSGWLLLLMCGQHGRIFGCGQSDQI